MEWYIIILNNFPNERSNLKIVEKNSTALANIVKLCNQSLLDNPQKESMLHTVSIAKVTLMNIKNDEKNDKNKLRPALKKRIFYKKLEKSVASTSHGGGVKYTHSDTVLWNVTL